jgi:hypothetical protein
MILARNEYQGYLLGGKGGWCVQMTTLPPSCADYLEILRAARSLKGLFRPVILKSYYEYYETNVNISVFYRNKMWTIHKNVQYNKNCSLGSRNRYSYMIMHLPLPVSV